jgi:hypothetical protein
MLHVTDTSWEGECAEFMEHIRFGHQPAAGLCDPRAALRVVERINKGPGA